MSKLIQKLMVPHLAKNFRLIQVWILIRLQLLKKYVGPNPKILALPQTFKVGAVHLCMKDEPYQG